MSLQKEETGFEMTIEIEWVKCTDYRSATDYKGVIYLHEKDGKPFYWGKAHNSTFGVRYNAGYRHWIEGCLISDGVCLYIGKLNKGGLELIDELEMQLIHKYGSVMNVRRVEPKRLYEIKHGGEIPSSIANYSRSTDGNTLDQEVTLADYLVRVVPTGSNVEGSLNLYQGYLNAANDEEPSRLGFIEWQHHAERIAQGTASANWYPLSELNGLGVLNRTNDELEMLNAGGYDALVQVFGVLPPGDSGRCLKCAFLVGDIQGMEPVDRTTALIERGCAGTPGSAAIVLAVGKSFGQHFGLIDDNGNSTANYEEYFADWRAMG